MVRAIRAVGLALATGCALLQTAGVVPLRFSTPPDRDAELRLLAPGRDRPVGGAAIRLWARVENPNSFGLRLSRVAGDLRIEDAEPIGVDFPLGLPLSARQDTVIPLDVSLSFDALPRLASLARTVITGRPLAYQVMGSFTVDAGRLGSPSFGPLELLAGEIRLR